MPKSLVQVIGLCTVILLGGCARNESTVSPNVNLPIIPAQLVGSWEAQSVALDGVAASIAVGLQLPTGTTTEMILINGGGDYFLVASDPFGGELYAERGTLRVTGQEFSRTVNTSDGQPVETLPQTSGQWEASENNITLTFVNGGRTVAVRYVRSQWSDWFYQYY